MPQFFHYQLNSLGQAPTFLLLKHGRFLTAGCYGNGVRGCGCLGRLVGALQQFHPGLVDTVEVLLNALDYDRLYLAFLGLHTDEDIKLLH